MHLVLLSSSRSFGIRAAYTAAATTKYRYTRTSSAFTPISTSSAQGLVMAEKKNITIIGGGIIGCCTAYYLTRHPSYDPAIHNITLLEASNTNSGGRLADNALQDPASLLDDPSLTPYNPSHAGIAGGASGKAGGLLALWAFPSNIVPLSFKLHDELAKEHNGSARWGYRRCYAAQVECKARKPLGTIDLPSNDTTASTTKGLHKDHRTSILESKGAPPEFDWLSTDSLKSFEIMGDPSNTAQVHPELFTRSLAALAEEKGVKILTGCQVTSINSSSSSSDKAVESVTYTNSSTSTTETLPTTSCIVAAGPWTRTLLPNIPVTASRAHSIVLRTPGGSVSPHALFTSITMPPPSSGGEGRKGGGRAVTVEPEIYPRPDGTAYACGTTDSDVPLPKKGGNAGVQVDGDRCAEIEGQVEAVLDDGLLSANKGKVDVLARQACYLPQGGPYIGPVTSSEGLIVAAGHTCWGIQNGPATGKLVSELVFDGEARSARLGGCDPRFL